MQVGGPFEAENGDAEGDKQSEGNEATPSEEPVAAGLELFSEGHDGAFLRNVMSGAAVV